MRQKHTHTYAHGTQTSPFLHRAELLFFFPCSVDWVAVRKWCGILFKGNKLPLPSAVRPCVMINCNLYDAPMPLSFGTPFAGGVVVGRWGFEIGSGLKRLARKGEDPHRVGLDADR